MLDQIACNEFTSRVRTQPVSIAFQWIWPGVCPDPVIKFQTVMASLEHRRAQKMRINRAVSLSFVSVLIGFSASRYCVKFSHRFLASSTSDRLDAPSRLAIRSWKLESPQSNS